MRRWINIALSVVVVFGVSGLAASAVADDKAKVPLVTYDDHVWPIFREHCFSCHNRDQTKGGLALDSYGSTIEGGSSGEVVLAEDTDSSRLWALITHAEEPTMPPMQEKLPKAKLDLIEKWILGGLRENSGSKAVKRKKSTAMAMMATGGGKPKGPAAMPKDVLRQPVVYTERAGAVSAMAASPWAPLVAVAGHQQVVLYHTESARCLGVLPFPEGVPYVLRFSRNGEVLLVGGGRGGHSGCVVLYNVRTGKRITKIGDELDAVLSADINDDMSKVALGGPQRIVRIYSTATGELLHEIRKHTDWVLAIRFSPDGVLLATADRSNGLFVWEADTAREYLDLRGHNGPIWEVAWRPDSNVLASSGQDGTVRLWELNDGKEIKRVTAHRGGSLWVSYGQDGRFVTAGNDKTVKLWQGDGKALGTFTGYTEPTLKAILSHDGKRVVGGDWSGSVKLWDSASRKALAELPPNPPTLTIRLELAKTASGQAAAAAKAAQAAYQAAATKHQALTKTQTDQQSKLKQLQTQLSTATAQLAAANKQVAALKPQIAKIKAAADNAAKIAAAKKAAVTATATKVRDLESQLAQALKLATKNAQEQQARDAKIEQLMAARKTAVAARAKAEQEAASAAKSMAETQQQFSELSKQLVAQTAAAQKAAAAAKQLKAQIPVLQKGLEQTTKELAALAKDVAAKKAAADGAQQTAAAAASEIKAVADELARFNALRQSLTTLVATAEQSVAKATADHQKLDQQAKQLAEMKAAADKQIAAVNAKLKELQTQLAKLQQERGASEQRLAAVKGEAAKLQAAVEEAQYQLQEAAEKKAFYEQAYGRYWQAKPDQTTSANKESPSVAGK